MTSHTRQTMQLAEQAADWVTRLDDEPTPECRAELVSWLRTSPQHVDEFLLAQATYRMLHELGPVAQIDIRELLPAGASNIVSLKDTSSIAAPGKVVPDKRKRWAMAAAAAGSACLLGLWFLASGNNARTYSTAVGEQRSIRLADGSLLTLNTQSEARVLFSSAGRHIELIDGEALFDITRDPARPFRVSAGKATIHVLGTQFNVRQRKGETRVWVVNGRVQVEGKQTSVGSAAAPALLAAGEEARIQTNGAVTRQPEADMEKALAWRQRRLVFHGTPLAEVVEEFNRYSEQKIRLEGESLMHRQISGVFHADDPETILKFLRKEPGVSIESREDEVLIRTRAQGAPKFTLPSN